jgi:hypothetical protein
MNPYLFDPMQRHRLAPTWRVEAPAPFTPVEPGTAWWVAVGHTAANSMRRVLRLPLGGGTARRRTVPEPSGSPTCCAPTCCA